MTNLTNYGRIFFGLAMTGTGLLHFFYPGIRPLIIPNLKELPAWLSWLGYFTGIVIMISGIVITIGKKFTTLSLVMGWLFLLFFLFGHLPAFLIAGPPNGNFWVNMNKMLALSGGYLVVANISSPIPAPTRLPWLAKLAPVGMYLFAMMLYNFSVGHVLNLTGVSGLVPKYIPFPQFWTFAGGIALMGSAISIFTGKWTKQVTLALAIVLFIWLILLHMYYAVRFPAWQEGENFIGVLSCLAFCGTALLISRKAE